MAKRALDPKGVDKIKQWRADWCLFAREVLRVNLDPQQEEILRSVQVNKRTSVASGTARGKDYTAAVAAMCFLYLTPEWDGKGRMVRNTKVAMTAPTGRQVGNIMFPEIARIFHHAYGLTGRLVGYDIRTDTQEWFLTGFKADEHNHEAWSGFHAANTMFVVTEASGISESVFNAIEGNLQGNSRILIVFNPNTPVGYAANSQRSPHWRHFRLDSLTAPNVLEKRELIMGQVDYEWVCDKVRQWCQPIAESDVKEEEGDFSFSLPEVGASLWYRPNDLFRVKVRGMFPRVAEDVLIPLEWITRANQRWLDIQAADGKASKMFPSVYRGKHPLRLGVDVAGMGRDSTSFCFRYGSYVEQFKVKQSGGTANHMETVGETLTYLNANLSHYHRLFPQVFLDTIGEGAGVYSRLEELVGPESGNKSLYVFQNRIHSVKVSAGPSYYGAELHDKTGEYSFVNLRAYLHWALRDWLNPAHYDRHTPDGWPALPPDDLLTQELTEVRWAFRSDGRIQIEKKEDLIGRLKRSPDRMESLLLTFYPAEDARPQIGGEKSAASFFPG